MLNIDPKSLSAIWQHALDSYPLECCGVLLGRQEGADRHVKLIARCQNVHGQPAIRYAIDPSELIGIQRYARDLQLEIVGFYHSHPDRPPAYSPTDLEEANWAGCSYLIVGVERHNITSARSFVLHVGQQQRSFLEEPLVETPVQL